MIPISRPILGAAERERVSSVLESGMLADGSEVRAFEDEFADYCGAEYGVATSNGTTALQAALSALGIGEGDCVLTTPFSFIATANAIKHVGAEPVFADIDSETYNLDPGAVQEVVAETDVDAILGVHLYGLSADMAELSDIADELNVPLIEDCAQAHGATYRGQRVGTFGDVACFSFYPTKNMTTGEGGMIVTDRRKVADRVRQFIDHGRSDTYIHEFVGYNFRMTNIAAAIGRVQLERLSGFIERRRANAAQLTANLTETSLVLPEEPQRCRHVYHQYTIRAPEREELQQHLKRHGVATGIYYPVCIHNQPAYELDHVAPVAERVATEVLSLPVHPSVTRDDVDHISEVILDYAQ
ncbi:DegT/DnrJ/EryC1/StrS family aminotransferase [Halobacteria archaeon AArc-m2/3/4]|uniref:DegT/DnrJ/EryC1/StrS family aminotransferase n=1 Tax=Natronoglomus mannanivorans TaxID=2979990 RepID=A0ABT2QKA2_9EURY|nr:DegT/DnrJ/EryC1/StrS family aminotransferase [Halobacteria archaeon AArc-m2/3/4]